MTIYRINYTRLKPKKELEATVTAKDMTSAVSKVVAQSTKYLINITNIKVSVKNEIKGAVQCFCDSCLVNMACYGIKGKWYCNVCKEKGV